MSVVGTKRNVQHPRCMAAQRAGQIGVLSEMGKVSNKTEMKQSFPGTLAQNV